MTEEEKVMMTSTLSGRDVSADISAYLALAGDAILQRRYPFGIPDNADISRYDVLQCRLAARYLDREGASGEISHTELSTTRIYGTANDEDLLMEVTPYAGI